MSTLSIWSPRPDAKSCEHIAPDIVLHGLPVIRITAVPFAAEVLQDLQALIFVSHHAVVCALAQYPLSYFRNKTVIAIGKRTAATLRDQYLPPALTAPPPYHSEALLADKAFQALPCQRIGIVSGLGGRTLLYNELTRRCELVAKIHCYRRDKIHLSAQVMIEFIDSCAIGGIILSSDAIAEAVANQLKRNKLQRCFALPVFVLSERIAMRAQRLGFSHCIVAEQANRHFLYQRIINWWEGAL